MVSVCPPQGEYTDISGPNAVVTTLQLSRHDHPSSVPLFFTDALRVTRLGPAQLVRASLLQIALLMPAHGNFRADIPLVAQRVLFTILRPVAWLLGYRSSYAQYAAPVR